MPYCTAMQMPGRRRRPPTPPPPPPHLEALHQRVVACGVRLKPSRLLDVVAQGVLGNRAAAAAASAAGK